MTETDTTPPQREVRWSSHDPSDHFDVHDPSTGNVIAVIVGAGQTEVDAAVRAAHAAYPGWHARGPRQRGYILRRVADALRKHRDEIARLESSDNGKPIDQAIGDAEGAIFSFEMFGSYCEAIAGSTRDGGSIIDVSMLEPHGVVAGIVPFNWPAVHTAGRPLAPALAVGNAVVIKPPEQAPLSALLVAEIVASAIPDDVVHVVPGPGSTGAQLVAHPLVRKVTFTGSPDTGVSVLKAIADNLTPATMELGGKNPFIVFADADLDRAVSWALEAGFFNQGEACSAASRMLVEATVYEEVVARYAKAVAGLRVGPGLDPATHIGPAVTEAHQQRVLDYIRVGVAEGARIVAEAALPDDPALGGGYWVAPTLFADVTPSMRIAREEIFGPVVAILPFTDEAEAVKIANGTDFGLMAAVFTADAERQLRVARSLHAGIVHVNSYSRELGGTPFGGAGRSGYGREGTLASLSSYGYLKTIRLPSGREPIRRWPAALEACG
jgi:acyl-CoA reductase-like NAD-dependent aldehyde dehydrogenase